MKVSMIVAIGENNAIGKDNKMLWHIPEDFKYFKETTMGKPIIMGRKTFESIGKALPGRTNVIITRDPDWQADQTEVTHSLEDAITLARREQSDEIFIIGGAQIYEQAMGFATHLYVTEVHQSYEADAYFPQIEEEVWKEVSRQDFSNPKDNQPDYSFVVFEHISPI